MTKPIYLHILSWFWLLLSALMAGGMYAYATTLPAPFSTRLSLVATGMLMLGIMLTVICTKIVAHINAGGVP